VLGVEGRLAGRDGATGVDTAARRGAFVLTMRVAGRAASGAGRVASGFAVSDEITPSDSVTGALDADVTGAEVGTAALSALTALEAWFWRTAKYEPPAAAARHPTDNPAKTSLLNSIFFLRSEG
jgi:hypothetical protein